MQRGALAMFDALGFKGIWRRVSAPEVVVDKLRRMQGSLEEYLRTTFGGDGQPALRDPANVLRSVQATFLSDTVTVAVVPKAMDEVGEGLRGSGIVTPERLAASAVAYAATLSGHVMRAALGAPPAWAYRGCIAYGEFHMDDRFLVGEAVDEAAERMGAADGAFVWLAPSAKAAFEKSPDGFGGRCTPLTRYGVPLKAVGGVSGVNGVSGVVETFVASPFPWLAQPEEARAVVERLMGTFDGSAQERVMRMARNTREFLRAHLEDRMAERAEQGRLFG
jgi:hypothetical protein